MQERAIHQLKVVAVVLEIREEYELEEHLAILEMEMMMIMDPTTTTIQTQTKILINILASQTDPLAVEDLQTDLLVVDNLAVLEEEMVEVLVAILVVDLLLNSLLHSSTLLILIK